MQAMFSTLRHRNGTTEDAISFYNKSAQHVTVTIAALEKLIDTLDFWDDRDIMWPESIQLRDGSTDRTVRFFLGDSFITVDDNRHVPMQFQTWDFIQLVRRLI